jgi:hypothetical protein
MLKPFKCSKTGNPLEDVAIELDIKTNVVLDFYRDYLILIIMNWLVDIYQDLKNDFPFFNHLYRRVKKRAWINMILPICWIIKINYLEGRFLY